MKSQHFSHFFFLPFPLSSSFAIPRRRRQTFVECSVLSFFWSFRRSSKKSIVTKHEIGDLVKSSRENSHSNIINAINCVWGEESKNKKKKESNMEKYKVLLGEERKRKAIYLKLKTFLFFSFFFCHRNLLRHFGNFSHRTSTCQIHNIYTSDFHIRIGFISLVHSTIHENYQSQKKTVRSSEHTSSVVGWYGRDQKISEISLSIVDERNFQFLIVSALFVVDVIRDTHSNLHSWIPNRHLLLWKISHVLSPYFFSARCYVESHWLTFKVCAEAELNFHYKADEKGAHHHSLDERRSDKTRKTFDWKNGIERTIFLELVNSKVWKSWKILFRKVEFSFPRCAIKHAWFCSSFHAPIRYRVSLMRCDFNTTGGRETRAHKTNKFSLVVEHNRQTKQLD